MNEINIDRKEYDKNQVPAWYTKSRYVIYYVLGLLEIMLGLRFIFMLLGANPRSGFTSFLYSVTGIFIAP
ncbi:MAG: YggT family protein, partial [Ruminiclostridium sp.]|nr:YggT family protein [Ruminiclostridium sp.]